MCPILSHFQGPIPFSPSFLSLSWHSQENQVLPPPLPVELSVSIWGHFPSVSVPHGCGKKWPQNGQLKTTFKRYMFSLRVLEARSLKPISLGQNQGVIRATLIAEVLRENAFLASSRLWLPALLGLRLNHLNPCLCGHVSSSSSICNLLLILSYKDIWLHLGSPE